jgi:hypothetical protein
MDSSAEHKYDPNYNAGYTKEDDMASVVAANVLQSLGIFDRITLKNHMVVAEKYMVGSNYGRVVLTLASDRGWNSPKDPYIVNVSWTYNDKQVSLDEILGDLGPKAAMKLAFNMDYLSQQKLDLREYNKNGLNYN